MNIYTFNSYRQFLHHLFDQKLPSKKKTDLANYLNCNPGFISQALSSEKTHFSAEHIFKVGKFFDLQEEEIRYLLLLNQFERAGSLELKKLLKKELEKIQQSHKEITSKIRKTGQELNEIEKSVYYSHWAYMAIHMAVSLSELDTVKKLANHFKIDSAFVEEIIQFLLEKNLIEKLGKYYSIGKTRVHLDRGSPLTKTLHQNWRQKAINALINTDEINLHYSSVLVLSYEDAERIKTLILQLIEKKEAILAPSKEERMVVFNIDYFGL